MAEVLEINDWRQAASQRMLWDYLVSETPRASFFHTYAWLDSYWAHFGREQKLRLLVAKSNGKPIGIVPLCVRRQPYRFGSVRVLCYPLDNWGDWYSAIGSNQAAAMILAMQHVRHTPRDWDMIDLRWTGLKSCNGGRPARAMSIAGLHPERVAQQTNALVSFSGSWSQYLTRMQSKRRSEFRRIVKRTFQKSSAQYIRHRPAPARVGDGDPRWDLYDMCEAVASQGWQAHTTAGNTLSSPRVRDFLRNAHEEASRLGMVDLNLLVVDGSPMAFAYNYHCEGRLLGLRMGYDQQSGNSSFGTALLLRSIEDSFRRGDKSLDLGSDEWPFKRRLQTDTETSYRLSHVPFAAVKTQALRLADWAGRRLRTEKVSGKSVSAAK